MSFPDSTSQFLLNLVFPPSCNLCSEPLKELSTNICKKCLKNFKKVPMENRVPFLSVNDGIDAAYSGWYFTKGLENIIHSLKYNGQAKLGLELGRSLGHLIQPDVFQHIDSVIPVPLHSVKYRDRGYNQAEWIGKGIAEVWQVPCTTKILKRVRFTVSQTTLNKEEREENMKKSMIAQGNVNGQSIVIVDDVLTTGSTMSACARTLKNAGAINVFALTLAMPVSNS